MYLFIIILTACWLPDLHHRVQRAPPGLPKCEHEPSETCRAGAQHGRGVLWGPETRPYQHTRQLGHGAHADTAHPRVSIQHERFLKWEGNAELMLHTQLL